MITWTAWRNYPHNFSVARAFGPTTRVKTDEGWGWDHSFSSLSRVQLVPTRAA